MNEKHLIDHLSMNPKMEGRTPHPGPLPIGSADAERGKRPLRLDVGMHGLVQGAKAQNRFGRILTPSLSPSLRDAERGLNCYAQPVVKVNCHIASHN
jgi:hypothetical protein